MSIVQDLQSGFALTLYGIGANKNHVTNSMHLSSVE